MLAAEEDRSLAQWKYELMQHEITQRWLKNNQQARLRYQTGKDLKLAKALSELREQAQNFKDMGEASGDEFEQSLELPAGQEFYDEWEAGHVLSGEQDKFDEAELDAEVSAAPIKINRFIGPVEPGRVPMELMAPKKRQ
jgi:hypothetical protein